MILLGVENLEQGRRRIAAKVRADLVDFIHHENRIVGSRLMDALNHASGHGADVRAAMAANFRFVVNAAQAHAHELPAERPAIDLPSDVLPTPGGPTKQRMGPLESFFSLRTARCSMMRSLIFSRP